MRILVGYDGSGSAKAAFEDLLRAGLPRQAEAMVLSVADLVPLPESPREAVPEADAVKSWRAARQVVLAEAAAWAKEGCARLQALQAEWKVTADTRADSPAWALLDAARSWRADLLCVGSHGRGALGRAVFGSVAQLAVAEAPCTVRVARHHAAHGGAGVRLVVGVDGSDGGGVALEAVLGREWPAGSSVRVVTAVDTASMAGHGDPRAWARSVNDEAAAKLAARGLDAAKAVVDRDAKQALVDEAVSSRADAVFVGAHGARSPRRRLLGSVAAAVAARSPCSVEIVRSSGG